MDVREGKRDEPRQVTLKEFGEMYMRIRTDLSERSRDEHDRTIRFLREQLGDQRPLHRIMPLDARRFIAWYRKRKVRGKPVSPATVNKVLRESRRFFREAVDCQLIKTNPFTGMRSTKVPEVPWHHVTPTEFHTLLDSASSARWQGIVALAYCCGLRLGEILNLTWSDVDLATKTVRVVAKRGELAEDWAPKDKDMRVVPLPTPACVVLTKLWMARDQDQIYVVTMAFGPNAGKPIPRRNTWRDFDVIRRRASLPPCSLHDLRRSYCTNLSKSMPMHVVQELAGHSDIRTTRRYYVKVQPELFDEARRVMENALAC
ncbi:MAG: tyrosine-type recombinase/integrase [Phycisphaerae bacterium]